MRVLRVGDVEIDRAQAHVLERAPVARQRLDVAAVLVALRGLEGVRLDAPVEADRALERFLLAGCAEVLRERIDAESLSIGLLARIEEVALVIDHPDQSGVLLVPEVLEHVGEGPLGRLAVKRLGPDSISGRKGPENASVQDRTLGRGRLDLKVVRDQAVEAALLFVDGALGPEGKDVLAQLALGGGSQGRKALDHAHQSDDASNVARLLASGDLCCYLRRAMLLYDVH